MSERVTQGITSIEFSSYSDEHDGYAEWRVKINKVISLAEELGLKFDLEGEANDLGYCHDPECCGYSNDVPL